jgi:hypothetical protein
MRSPASIIRQVDGSKRTTQGWDVTWFDSQAGVSYRLATENGADPGDFDSGLSPKNQAGAQQLVAVAEKLVLWTGT